jgi:penicillin-binding protein 2
MSMKAVFKPLMLSAALAVGAAVPMALVGPGTAAAQDISRLGEYRDWREGGHGWVDLKSALEQSANVYFYDLAHALGIDRISRELALFGFGQPTGIDLPGEFDGVLPSRNWKRRTLDQAWFPGETVITGIGQGFIVATPLQLAHATATLAGRGMAARLVDAEPPARMVEHAPGHWEAVFEGMHAVVHGKRGTARAIARNIPVEIGGKTGTSQVFGRPDEEFEIEPEELPWFLRNHALFVAFAPFDDPRIAIAVVAEHGGGGSSVAAPVAAKVLERATRVAP